MNVDNISTYFLDSTVSKLYLGTRENGIQPARLLLLNMADQEPTFYLLKRRLPSQETPLMLGRIVRSFQDPTASYVPEDPTLVIDLASHLQETHDHDVSLLAKASRDNALTAKLQGLLSLGSSYSGQSEIRVESSSITTRRLKNLDSVWTALKADMAIATLVQEMIRSNGKAYLVIGVMTIQSGNIRRTGAKRSEQNASAHIPIGAAATASGMAVVPPNAAAELTASHGKALDWEMNGTVGQNGDENPEEIFAVEYKVLKRSWLRKDIKMQDKVPDYKGGSTYAADSGDDDDDSDDNEPNDQQTGLDEVRVIDEYFFLGANIAGQKWIRVLPLTS